MKKILYSIIVIALIMFLIIPNYSRAFSLDDIFSKGEDFLTKGQENETLNETEVKNTVVPIAQVLVAIGSLVIALATGILAIKYLMAGPEKRGELKGQLVGLVVATVVIYGAQIIWSTMYNIFNNI